MKKHNNIEINKNRLIVTFKPVWGNFPSECLGLFTNVINACGLAIKYIPYQNIKYTN